MFSCLQILEAFLWFVLITLLNVTLIILTLSVSRLLNLLLRLEIGRAVQQECRDRSRMPSSARKQKAILHAGGGPGASAQVRAGRPPRAPMWSDGARRCPAPARTAWKRRGIAPWRLEI